MLFFWVWKVGREREDGRGALHVKYRTMTKFLNDLVKIDNDDEFSTWWKEI